MMQVSKILGCCCELMQLLDLGDSLFLDEKLCQLGAEVQHFGNFPVSIIIL